mmetsp:Transcript_49928/g.142853  ORF Transcript_49928/g.142853 Transcript_49928/m.142853 type:complete len:256 (+) Transcript_49928:1367-2134(+)
MTMTCPVTFPFGPSTLVFRHSSLNRVSFRQAMVHEQPFADLTHSLQLELSSVLPYKLSFWPNAAAKASVKRLQAPSCERRGGIRHMPSCLAPCAAYVDFGQSMLDSGVSRSNVKPSVCNRLGTLGASGKSRKRATLMAARMVRPGCSSSARRMPLTITGFRCPTRVSPSQGRSATASCIAANLPRSPQCMRSSISSWFLVALARQPALENPLIILFARTWSSLTWLLLYTAHCVLTSLRPKIGLTSPKTARSLSS